MTQLNISKAEEIFRSNPDPFISANKLLEYAKTLEAKLTNQQITPTPNEMRAAIKEAIHVTIKEALDGSFTHVFASGDILTIRRDSGEYASIGKVKHYTVLYGEYFNYGDDDKGYMAHQSEYFPLNLKEEAILAFLSRLNSDSPSTSTGKGYSLETIAKRSS